MAESRRNAALAAAVLLGLLSLWSLVHEVRYFPKEYLLAVRAADLRDFGRQEGLPSAEMLERLRAAGATAITVPDQTFAEAEEAGRVYYFTRGQAAAMKALGLIDPNAPFPDEALWLAEGETPEATARILRESGIRFSTASFAGRPVFRFPQGLELSSLRGGPDSALLNDARGAGLLPVYQLASWDRNAQSILGAAAGRADFPRLAYAPLFGEDRERFLDSPQHHLLDEGVFLPAGQVPGDAMNVWNAVEVAPTVSERRTETLVQDGRARLVILDLSGKDSFEAALATVRATASTLAETGMIAVLDTQLFRGATEGPPVMKWFRRPLALLLVLALPVLCIGLGMYVLHRLLHSPRWPLAAPAWQLMAAYGTVAVTAIFGGVLLDGILGPCRPTLARILPYLPFVVGAAFWYRDEKFPSAKRLDRAVTLRLLVGLILSGIAIGLVWIRVRSATLAAPGEFPWRAILFGAPALFGAMWIRNRREAGLSGLFEDERPLLVLGLWLPLQIVAGFYLSQAPFWVMAARSLKLAALGLLAGALVLLSLSHYELRIRPWAIKSKWI